MMEKGKPASRQGRIFYILLGLFAALLLNSLILFLLDYDWVPDAYQGTLVFHLLLGTLLSLPLGVFLAIHLKRMPHRANRKAMMAGIFTASGLLLTLLTGWGLYWEELAAHKDLLLSLHIGAVGITISALYWHIQLKRKRIFHFYIPLRKKSLARASAWTHTFKWALIWPLLGFILLVILLRPLPSARQTYQAGALEPGNIALESHAFLPPETLDDAVSCGQAGCHPDIYDQWESSAHHFSSFNNPWYKRSVELLLAENDPVKLKWCASCHDPLLISSAALQDFTPDLIDTHPLREKGISCLSCHAITAAVDLKGNGNQQLADPGYARIGQSLWGEVPGLRNTVIQTKSGPHAAALSTDFLRADQFCTSCHKVSIPPSVNDYRWKRGQNHYDAWRSSSFSQQNPRTYYTREYQNCVSCHMPLVPSDDKGNKEGLVKGHRFAAAHSALATLNDDPEQLEAVKNFLQNDIAALDLFKIEVNGVSYGPKEKMPLLEPGDAVKVHLVVSNKNAGHSLPSGTNDSNEWWIALEAQDTSGAVLLSSGSLDSTQTVDPNAHFLKALLIDHAGEPILRRNVQDWHATVYAHAIPAGISQLVHYAFRVPDELYIHQLSAHLNQRKFNVAFHRFSFAEQAPPPLPLITVASSHRKADTVSQSQLPLWKRWNNYGIGLVQETQLVDAIQAFGQVDSLRPDLPDGLTNQGRTYLADGNVSKAESLLREARKKAPDHAGIAFFLGQALFEQGDFSGAQKLWEEVYTAFPNDLLLLTNLGELAYLSGEFATAETYYQAALAVDPEWLGALYGMMLSSGAQNKTEAAADWKDRYLYHKPNEAEEIARATFKKKNPSAQIETQNPHYHSLNKVGSK